MHCPSCGREASIGQQFCRSCGMSLQPVSELLASEFPSTESPPPSGMPSNFGEAKLIKRMFWGLIICIVGIIIGVVGGKILHQNLVAVVGALLGAAGLLIFLSVILSAAGISHQSARSKALPSPKTTKQLPPESFYGAIPSVAEWTTELLEIEKERVSGRKHN